MSAWLEGERGNPSPRIGQLPAPSLRSVRPIVALSQLTPRVYTDVVARVASMKVSERHDQLGTKQVSSGVLEDSTFRVPYLCYKLSLPLAVNSVFRFRSAYVREFVEDGSLLLILTEYSRAEAVAIDSLKDYYWLPRIGRINRPVYDVSLTGVVSSISDLSGLVKRCNNCKRVITFDACPQGCDKNGWSWDLRVSARLYDGTGSIKMILTRSVAARILNKSIGEILFAANSVGRQEPPNEGDLPRTQSFVLRLPEELNVWEAEVKDALSLRKRDRMIVPDGVNLVYFTDEKDRDSTATDAIRRKLDSSNPDDCRVIRKLVEKALDIRVRERTSKLRLHDTYLLEDPIPLYSCEAAKLYLGLSVRTTVSRDRVQVQVTTSASVRESVLDYIRWRRGRGASATAIESSLLRQRSNVLLGPSDRYGHIERLLFEKAGDMRVSSNDSRNLVDFWRDVYGAEVSPDEMPLVKVRPADSEVHLTYPPSTIYFGGNVLFVPGRTLSFISFKKSSLEGRSDSIVRKSLEGLTIGEAKLELQSDSTEDNDFQGSLLHELQDKLYGRNLNAKDSITRLSDRLYFFPNAITLL